MRFVLGMALGLLIVSASSLDDHHPPYGMIEVDEPAPWEACVYRQDLDMMRCVDKNVVCYRWKDSISCVAGGKL